VRWIEAWLVSTLSIGLLAVCLVSLGGCPSNPTPRCAPGCEPGLVCDRGYCIPGMPVPPDAAMPLVDSGCGASMLFCEAHCIDPRSDRDHCGRCGNRCTGMTDACNDGVCGRREDD
jgi:hypothetical protein